MNNNPKLSGSGIISCRPQTGPCPNGCSNCYYNHPGYYEDINQPNVPTPEEVGSRIVRMNDGHDSNVRRGLVLHTAAQYKDVFFNTSIPRLDFPGPVVLTVNPREDNPTEWIFPGRFTGIDMYGIDTLMAVRVRLTPAWTSTAAVLIEKWRTVGVPVLVSHMRYYSRSAMLAMLKDASSAVEADYERRSHILNTSYQPRPALKRRLEATVGVGRPGVYLCEEKLCAACGQCEAFYHLCKRRLNYAV